MILSPTFDASSPLPLYEQLYRYLREEMEHGRLLPGAKLPSKRQLASDLKISVVTVENAYSQLVAEGYLKSENRRGFFVQRSGGAQVSESSRPLRDTLPQLSPQQYRYDFATNAVDAQYFPFATWAKLTREVLSSRDSALLTAAPPQGVLELRKAIVEHLYHFRGIRVSTEQIVVGAGSEFLTSLLVQLLGREGGYAVEDPGYPKTAQILSHCGARVVPVKVDEQGLNVEALGRSGASVAHVTPSHHFPTGVIMPVSRRLELLEWAAAKPERYIIEDDYDAEFRLTGRPIPALQGLDRHERVIYLNTFTKSLAPSMRISYMVLPLPLAEKYRKELLFYSSTVPSFEQHILALFMERGHLERHISRTRKRYRARRDALLMAAAQSGLTDFASVRGEDDGLHLLLTVHSPYTETELVRRAAAEGIHVYPLSDYYHSAPGQIQESVFLLGYARLGQEEMPEAFHRLVKCWTSPPEPLPDALSVRF